MDSSIIFNPVLVSVILLCILCLRKVNVLLALIISALVAGKMAGMPIGKVMNIFVDGMGANSETALSYILLGTFAAAMMHTGLTNILSDKIEKIVKNKKFVLLVILTVLAVMSQNVIPVHIAFIPILVPPLLKLMNSMKLDRRAAACALAYGLKMPYIAIPAGFGLIFQGLIAVNMTQNGMSVSTHDVCSSVWILGVAMTVGLLVAICITYRKPREYKEIDEQLSDENNKTEKFNKKHLMTIFAALMTFLIQLWTKSLPLGAIVGLTIIFGTGVIKHDKTDKLIDEGIGLMGYIAFVMLIAAGFALVLKNTGGIDSLVSSLTPMMSAGKFAATLIMLIIGLFITIGIGTSFGTIPILAVLFVPICMNLNFSVFSTIVIIAAAAALGDAGSPASDTTLGPTSGLNADGQHNHIKDTCIPTFLHYNIALIIFALIAVCTIFK